MTVYTIVDRQLHSNQGINKEQCLDHHLTGKHGKHDNLKWDKGSDIPEFGMSVKSSKFSLCAGGQLKGETLAEMIEDYFARVASKVFAYVTNDFKVYEMTATEFKAFLVEFTYLAHESERNGGKAKIRAKAESKKMVDWLAERV